MAAKVGKHVRRREVRLEVAAGGEGAEVSAGWGVISPWRVSPAPRMLRRHVTAGPWGERRGG